MYNYLKKCRSVIAVMLVVCMLFATGALASVWNEKPGAEVGYTGTYAPMLAESLNELKNIKATGGNTEIIENRLGNQIKRVNEKRAALSASEIAELHTLLDEIYAEVQGLEGFDIVVREILEFKNPTAVEEKPDPTPVAPEKKPLAYSFTDVKPGDWFYDTVMKMTEEGLFAGKGPVIDGVGTFAPYDVMTRAEFNAVLARVAFGETANTPIDGQPWWYQSDSILRASGLIGVRDFTDTVEIPMTREEMAYMSANLFLYGRINKYSFAANPIEYANLDGAKDRIPDYTEIAEGNYLSSVLECYSQGILCGMDDAGTFKPKGYLTRAEAASVLYRLLHKEARTPVDLSVN